MRVNTFISIIKIEREASNKQLQSFAGNLTVSPGYAGLETPGWRAWSVLVLLPVLALEPLLLSVTTHVNSLQPEVTAKSRSSRPEDNTHLRAAWIPTTTR